MFSGQRISQILTEARAGIPLPVPEKSKRENDEAQFKPSGSSQRTNEHHEHAQQLAQPPQYQQPVQTLQLSQSAEKLLRHLQDAADATDQMKRIFTSDEIPSFQQAIHDVVPVIDRAIKQSSMYLNSNASDEDEHMEGIIAHTFASISKTVLRLLERCAEQPSKQSTSLDSHQLDDDLPLCIPHLLCRLLLRMQVPPLQRGIHPASINPALTPDAATIMLKSMQVLYSLHESIGSSAPCRDSDTLAILGSVEAALETIEVIHLRLMDSIEHDVTCFDSGTTSTPTSSSAPSGMPGSIFALPADTEPAPLTYPYLNSAFTAILLQAAALGVSLIYRYCASESNRYAHLTPHT